MVLVINKNKKNPQSNKKVNSKLYLNKNIIPNLSVFNDISRNILPIQPNTNPNVNINNAANEQNNKIPKNRLTNIKFNIEKVAKIS